MKIDESLPLDFPFHHRIRAINLLTPSHKPPASMLLKAIEDKRFYPVGADKEVASDFQLIVGTNLDLREAVARGDFREDLFARINLWSYSISNSIMR